jgi:hypothetical protein
MCFIAKLMDPWCLLFVVGVPERATCLCWLLARPKGASSAYKAGKCGAHLPYQWTTKPDACARESLPAASMSQEQLVDKDVIIMSLLVVAAAVAPPFPHLSTFSFSISSALSLLEKSEMNATSHSAIAHKGCRLALEKNSSLRTVGKYRKIVRSRTRRSGTHIYDRSSSHM